MPPVLPLCLITLFQGFLSWYVMTTPIADNYCFVCGQDNPRGLKISCTYREAEMAAETELALPREFQGWAERHPRRHPGHPAG